jgi:hypothetical protein
MHVPERGRSRGLTTETNKAITQPYTEQFCFVFLERFIFSAYANMHRWRMITVRWDVVPKGTEPQTVETFEK